MNAPEQLTSLLPGEDLVQQGLGDLQAGRITEQALLVLIASPRLKSLGIQIAEVSVPEPYEHRLYELLAERHGNAAHSQYNSLIRRITSYVHALAQQNSSSRTRK